ncbi:LamG domain-containing protein [Candidatus Poribacteria bacterium]
MRDKKDLLAGTILVVFFAFAGLSYAVQPNDVLGIWLFDEKQGNVAIDASGNGRDGEIQGSVQPVVGKFGGGFSFPGVSDSLVIIPHDDGLNVGAFSITAWVNYELSDQQFQAIVTKGSEATTYGYYLIIYESPPLYNIAGFTPGPQDWREAIGSTDLTDGEWHHLAATYDRSFVRLYVDGVMEAELAVSNDPGTVDTPLAIGAQHDGFWPSNAVIDEVGLFSVGLTSDEVGNIMVNGLAAETGLTAAVSPMGNISTTWGGVKVQY